MENEAYMTSYLNLEEIARLREGTLKISHKAHPVLGGTDYITDVWYCDTNLGHLITHVSYDDAKEFSHSAVELDHRTAVIAELVSKGYDAVPKKDETTLVDIVKKHPFNIKVRTTMD